MKYNVIYSNTTLGGQERLFKVFEEQNVPGSQHVFIVPDRYTFGVEKEICSRYVTTGGAFNVDVCSFSRLAQKALGKKNRTCLSKEGTVLLLHRIIREMGKETEREERRGTAGKNAGTLRYYRKVRSPEFSREMFAAIASLRSSGIKAEEALCAAETIGGSVGDKLHDVAILWAAYEEALQNKYKDTITRVDWLVENLAEVDFLKESHVYVLGFNVYSNQQLAFLRKAIKECRSVTVAFCKSDADNKDCYPDFQERELLEYAKTLGKVKPIVSEKPMPSTFSFLHDELFSGTKKTFGQTPEGVIVYGYPDPYEEVRAVAREINALVFRDGYRYKEIAVVCNDAQYNPVFLKTFRRFGIPLFIDAKYEVKDGFFARYVLQAFACKTSKFDVRDVMTFALHPYAGYTRAETQAFREYCVRYSVKNAAFGSTFKYPTEKVSPTGTTQRTEEDIRSEIFSRIDPIPDEANARAYAHIIEEWAKEFAAKEEEYRAETRTEEEKRYADSSRFLALVREIETLLAEEPMTAAEFADTLGALLQNMTYGVLPQYTDSVFVGNTNESRFADVKVLFVAGAADGYFPVATGDKLVFGYWDVLTMKNDGNLSIFPTPEEINRFERFSVIDLMGKSETLYLSYAKKAFDTTPNSEGGAVREIKERLNLEEEPFVDHRDLTEEDKLLYDLSTLENCQFEYAAGRVPAAYGKAVREFLIANDRFDGKEIVDEKPDLLMGYDRTEDGAYKLSVSKMETYFDCPYKNFLKNVLRLREKVSGDMQVNEKGTLIHDVLERYFTNAEELKDLTAEEREDRARTCIREVIKDEKYDRFRETATGNRELRKLTEECMRVCAALTENMLHAQVTPWKLEQYFAAGEINLTAKDGKRFTFTGKIDRVDTDDDNDVVIIDYKSGSMHEGLASVYDGTKIQLYLYLKYYLDQGKEPLGVFYLPIPEGYSKDAVSYAMRGQILDDPSAFEKLDDRAAGASGDEYSSPNVYFTVRNENGKTIFTEANEAQRLTKEDFVAVTEYVMRLAERAIEEIEGGYMERKPRDGACTYCPYKVLCGEESPRESVYVDKDSFYPVTDEEIEVPEGKDGEDDGGQTE